MPPIEAYHRPATVAAALELLARPGVATAVLGGGTALVADSHRVTEVVDLQSVGLDAITWEPPHLTMGAMVRLRDLVEHELTPPLVRDLTIRHAPNTIRNAATVAGSIASSDSESTLAAALLAVGATVTLDGTDGAEEVEVESLLTDTAPLDGRIITSVAIRIDGVGAHAATARTPADDPIVLVAGWRDGYGSTRLAATGIAPYPVIVDPARVEELEPPSDFRGSTEYRRAIVATLVSRVISDLDRKTTS